MGDKSNTVHGFICLVSEKGEKRMVNGSQSEQGEAMAGHYVGRNTGPGRIPVMPKLLISQTSIEMSTNRHVDDSRRAREYVDTERLVSLTTFSGSIG